MTNDKWKIGVPPTIQMVLTCRLPPAPAVCRLPPYFVATKLYVSTPDTFIGSPIREVGVNLAWRAAATDTACKSGCPETA